MSGKKKQDYEVDYCKPPITTRFKKGQCPNRAGRPKKTPPEFDPRKVLQSIDNEGIVITVDGKRKTMLMAEVHFRQLFAKAIKGDLVAARLVANMAAKYFGLEAEG